MRPECAYRESHGRARCSGQAFRKGQCSNSVSHLPALQKPPGKLRTCDEGPFGEVVRSSGTMAKANPFRFSTKYQDDESDLLYYGYRYYNPSTGRWISRDPIEERGAVNIYSFVDGDPISAVDVDGRERGRICPICHQYYVGACPRDGYPIRQTPTGGGRFEFCRRQYDNPVGFWMKCQDQICGMHSYTRYTDPSGNVSGWGFDEGGTRLETANLLAAKSTTCAECRLSSNPLKYGSGQNTLGVLATADQIWDCLTKRPADKRYDPLTYNCWFYSMGAQKDCGLDCTIPKCRK